MHIGLIGGIGPAATVFYYERIVQAFANAGQRLHLSIAHTSAYTLSANVTAGNAELQAAEFVRVTEQLVGAGADVVAITSMGGHFCAPQFTARSPLPLVNGPDAVAMHLRQLGIERIGILGTRIVMQTRLYGSLSDFKTLVPLGDELTQVNDDYIAMATTGTATAVQRERLVAAGARLASEQNAQAVLLGGTDLNLVYDHDTLDVPVIDSAQVHADAIVTAALG